MEQHPKKAATPGSWKPGQSGNPKGRPRSGLALAEAIREHLDPETIVEMVEKFRTDDTVPLERRLAALLPWVHAGYLRPPTELSLTNGGASSDRADLSHLSIEQRREMLAELEAVERKWAALAPPEPASAAASPPDEPALP